MKKKVLSKPVVAADVAAKVAPISRTRPDIYAERLLKLTPMEREQLRAMITSPLYVKLLRIAATMKPSANATNCGSTTRDAFSDARANARLGEIRGWEFYEAAIYLSLNEPVQVKQAAQETFPDEGKVDAAWSGPVNGRH